MLDKIPDINRPLSSDPATQRFFDAVREAIRGLANNIGAATRSSSDNASLARTAALSVLASPEGKRAIFGADGVDPFSPCKFPGEPTDVAKITSRGSLGIMYLSFALPDFRGYKNTEIWVGKESNFSDGVLAGTSTDGLFMYPVPILEYKEGADGDLDYEVTKYFRLRHTSDCVSIKPGAFSAIIEVSAPPSAAIIGQLMADKADVMIEALGLTDTLSDLADGVIRVTTETGTEVVDVLSVKNSIDSAYAAVEAKADVSYVDDQFVGRYTIKTDNNGVVQGIGLLNTGDTATSGVTFNVSNFNVTDSNTTKKPFMISGGKVYAKDLFVESGNIDSLDASKITTGSLAAERIGAGTVSANSLTLATAYGNVQFGTVDSNSRWCAMRVNTGGVPYHYALSSDGGLAIGGYTYLQSTVTGQLTTGNVNVYGALYVSGGITGSVSSASSANTALEVSNSGTANLKAANGTYTAAMQSDGNFVVYHSGTPRWNSGTSVSDIKYKYCLGDTEYDCAAAVGRLRVVDFVWKDSSVFADGRKVHTGFIAQEVQQAKDDLVTDIGGTLVIDYNKMFPLLVKTIQSLTQRVNTLEATITGGRL